MARIKYTVTFPAARAGDEVTWPGTIKVYPDKDTQRPLQNRQSLDENKSFIGYSDATSVAFTHTNSGGTVTVTTGSPSGTGAAATNQAVPAGGTTGQVLQKASNTDGDVAWSTPSGGSVPNSYYLSSLNSLVDVPLGTSADGTDSTSLKWGRFAVSQGTDITLNANGYDIEFNTDGLYQITFEAMFTLSEDADGWFYTGPKPNVADPNSYWNNGDFGDSCYVRPRADQPTKAGPNPIPLPITRFAAGDSIRFGYPMYVGTGTAALTNVTDLYVVRLA